MKQENNYKGPFPVIELEGTPFFVNGYLMALVEVDRPENQIDLFDMMCLEDHYELWYDTETKQVYDGPLTGQIPEQVKLFWFYPFDAMDPQGRNTKLDEIKPGWRKDFQTDLPVIQIAGKDFFVDEKRKAFRDTENCWNMISFADVFKRGGKTGIYIDTRVTQVPFLHEFDPYHAPEELPEHIVFAGVPDGQHLAFLLNEWNNPEPSRHQGWPDEKRRIGR
ncbi:hypothetical protein G7092_16875 [Mucilaginibacter sp. HC2]|uniref:hypothetical protein n=1 Tax=Mucilaginibacter TaxID=423349 RepID=UPI00101A50E3|nr:MULTISPECIES: hypothetical protein [Mucilaginibacter]NHA05486.1 hypothetical protein [Mucilaginibacter inviolabilis]QTE35294.1 hypothetical protein J3L18_19350 [Mucilaginibacter gossypii]